MNNEHTKWKAILKWKKKESLKIIAFAIKIPMRVSHNTYKFKCLLLFFFIYTLLVILYDLYTLSFIFHAQLLLLFYFSHFFFILHSIFCSSYKGKHQNSQMFLHLIESGYKRRFFLFSFGLYSMVWHLWKQPNWIKFDSQRKKIFIYVFNFSLILFMMFVYIQCLHLLWFFFYVPEKFVQCVFLSPILFWFSVCYTIIRRLQIQFCVCVPLTFHTMAKVRF